MVQWDDDGVEGETKTLEETKTPKQQAPRKRVEGRTASTIIQKTNAEKKTDMGKFRAKRTTGSDGKEKSWITKGVTVGTDNVSYYVTPPKKMFSSEAPKRKALLSHVTLVVSPGEVTYLMGPSGAGKSTLLDVVAGRVKSGILSGDVLFNGKPRAADFYDNSAYVKQDDVHIPTLTVEETLTYAARLRMGEDYEDSEREERVHLVADLLGLEGCKKSIVGDASLRGISGGQKKRLSIAVEIMHMPSLIFLDEPTSGLDSVTSYEVMSFARDLSKQRRTILATIHQPSIETFNLSSKVILLKAGRLAYCGPTSAIVEYFSSPLLGYNPADEAHPADFALAAVSGSLQSSVHGSNCDPHMFSDLFKHSDYFETPQKDPHGAKAILNRPSEFPVPLWKQTLILIERFWKTQSRDYSYQAVTIGKNVLVAGICGAIFFNMGKAPVSTVFDGSAFNVASLWYFAMLYVIIAVMQIIPQLVFYKVLYFRERQANMYSTFAYWATHAVINIPLLFVAHVVFYQMAYWLVGLNANAGAHFFGLLVTFLCHMVAVYNAQLVASISPTTEVALMLFPLLFLFMASFAGFTIPIRVLPSSWLLGIPKGWYWFSFVCYTRWTYQALIYNQFRLRPDFKATIQYLGMEGYNMWWTVPILLAFLVATNFMLYLGLLPARSKLALEEPTEDAAYSGGAVAINVSQASGKSANKQTLDSFKSKSVNKMPSVEPMGLLFKDLEYSVGDAKNPKKILKGVTGHIEPGEMCALMGGSGAGKSTLLDLLAFRKTGGMITGDFYIGGKATRPTDKWNAYVTQDNVHIALFTVRETLHFAAQLRLEESLTTEQRYKRADDVMQMLGLDGVADVLVGDSSIKGISGGQARRLTIGVEIMQLPPVIFLDEPTTGLDSTISYEVMASVRAIADHNRTIVCTIHSPSEQVFMLFDKLILLALGRQTYYGSAEESVAYFSQPAFGWKMPVAKNPADFVMEGSQGMLGAEDNNRRSIRDLNETFLASANYKSVADDITTTLRSGDTRVSEGTIFAPPTTGCVDVVKPANYSRNAVSLVGILAWRQLTKMTKMHRDLVAGIVRNIVVGIFHGLLYNQLPPKAMQSRLSLMYFIMMFVMLANQSFVPSIFADRLLLYRERGAGVYGSFSYWISSSLPFIPQSLFVSAIYAAIVYPLTGLNPGWSQFWYFLVIVLECSLLGLYFCQAISFVVPSAAISVSLFPALLFVVTAFCGFVVRLPSLPKWLGWAGYASFARWAFQGLMINEFQGNKKVYFDPMGQVKNPFNGQPLVDPIPYSDDFYKEFIKIFGFQGYTKWDSVPILAYFIVGLFCFCYLPIRFISYEKR